MDSSSDLNLSASGSRLLSESPVLPGNGDDEFSISELSLSDRPRIFEKPFSLLARPPSPTTPVPTRRSRSDENEDGEDSDHEATQRDIRVSDEEEEMNEEDREKARRLAGKMREEKLQSDIFILKKLNAAFSSFNDALEDVGSANERISQQLEQTEGLLNRYVNILAKSEDFARLIFDEDWEGADMDIVTLERERAEAIERAQKEAEERALAAKREQERLEREAQERRDREEKERLEKDKKTQTASRGGVRGVRGTRASMRGMRGTSTRATTTRGISRANPTANSSRLPTTARGTARRS